jgi:hypothetical protein
MANRKFLCALITTAVSLSPVLANATQTFEVTNDEIGFVTNFAPTSVTREQVRQELAAWKDSAISSHAWSDANGEQGWQAPIAAVGSSPAQPMVAAKSQPMHWQAVDGEAGWVGPFGV